MFFICKWYCCSAERGRVIGRDLELVDEYERACFSFENIYPGCRFLKDLIDDEHPESASVEVLADRLREYVPDIPKDMEPVVMVRYSENDEIKKGKFDQQIADIDKDLFNKADQLPEGTEVIVKMYFTVYYPSEQVTANDHGAVKAQDKERQI